VVFKTGHAGHREDLLDREMEPMTRISAERGRGISLNYRALELRGRGNGTTVRGH